MIFGRVLTVVVINVEAQGRVDDAWSVEHNVASTSLQVRVSIKSLDAEYGTRRVLIDGDETVAMCLA